MKFRIIFPAFIFLLSAFTACKKEKLLPDEIGTPRFFVEAEANGKHLKIASGLDNFITMPTLDKIDLDRVTLAVYSSNFTNNKDTFSVGFLDLQAPFIIAVLPSKEALDRVFDRAMNNPNTLFTENAGVIIRWCTNGKVYSTPLNAYLQDGSRFNILKIEDYTPPGADHAMKKIDVTFSCMLQNEINGSDVFWLKDGKATLLFDYTEK